MKNVFWLIPNRLAGRPGPDREPWSLEELRAGGIHAVLNLSEFEPLPAAFAEAQLEMLWVPLPNTYPADDATEVACRQALPTAQAFLQAQFDAGRNVLVHCSLGRDRTGLLLAYHLAQSYGMSPGAAIARVREVCPKAISPGWEAMAERILATLTAPPPKNKMQRPATVFPGRRPF